MIIFMFRFINRCEELRFLEKRFKEKQSQLIIVYGRRRMGKTETIKQLYKDKDAIYFLGDRRGTLQNTERFAEIAARYFDDMPPRVKNFDDVFEYIAKKLNKKRLIIVIDEFSYLVEKDESIPSVFQLAWDEFLKNKNVMLILSGSSVSMMERGTLSYKSPLYGRRTGQIKLSPFTIENILEFYPNIRLQKAVEFYSVLGGIPFYLREFDMKKDVYTNIIEKILTKEEILYEEVEFLLREELRDYSVYLSIIESIAKGKSRIIEIADYSKIKPKDLPKYLNNLITLELIEKIHPVTEKKKTKKTIYTVKDNFFRFCFRFVQPYKSDIEGGLTENVIRKIKEHFNTFVGPAFENICKTILCNANFRNLLPFEFEKIGKQWGRIPKKIEGKNQYEIDMVGLNEKTKDILFCEIKWKNNVDGEKILYELKEKAGFVEWHKEKRKEHYMIIAKSFKKKTKDAICWDLKDLKRIIQSKTEK